MYKKNWAKDSISDDNNASVYKDNNDKNMRYTEYLINQALSVRFINVNYSEELKDFQARSIILEFITVHTSTYNHTYGTINKKVIKKGIKSLYFKYNDISNFYNKLRKYVINI